MRVGFLVLLAIFSLHAKSSNIKIAFIDTSFCIEHSIKNDNIKLLPPIDATKTLEANCSDYSIKKRKYHGQQVLNQFIKSLPKSIPLEIQPITVFDHNGVQKQKYWEKAFKNEKSYHLFVIAAGLINGNISRTNVPIFVAGATFGKGIRKHTPLWPQGQYISDSVITIGSYLGTDKDLRQDYNLVHPSQMNFFFHAGDNNSSLQGTSRAVATAAARAITFCTSEIVRRKAVMSCLRERAFSVELESNKKVQSY